MLNECDYLADSKNESGHASFLLKSLSKFSSGIRLRVSLEWPHQVDVYADIHEQERAHVQNLLIRAKLMAAGNLSRNCGSNRRKEVLQPSSSIIKVASFEPQICDVGGAGTGF